MDTDETDLFGEDEEENMTPDEAVKQMTMSWQNEICAPCLLPTKYDLVDILLDQIQGMEESLANQTNKAQLRISVHRMDLQRINYVTSDYIRCRLRKIEANPNEAIAQHEHRKSEDLPDLLSENEMKFAKEYARAEAELFDRTVLESLPAALKKISVPEMRLDDEMVYCKVLENEIGNISIPDWSDLNAEVILEMEKDSVHLIPFVSVKQQVEDGTIQLL
ncbi:unnamed protein product [Caenorhabditis sp. 36 PRJEB53466]|nr:unnamed protein product [Caenorhabditis sp. 36 PRJEB53466]